MTKAMFTFRDAAVANRTHIVAQAAVVGALAEHLGALKADDLTTRIEADFPGEYAY